MGNSKRGKGRTRSRASGVGAVEADRVEKPEDEEITRGSDNVMADLGLDDVNPGSQEPVEDVLVINLQPPFTHDGVSVIAGNGERIAICGFDYNRSRSGPPIAAIVAAALNRVVK